MTRAVSLLWLTQMICQRVLFDSLVCSVKCQKTTITEGKVQTTCLVQLTPLPAMAGQNNSAILVHGGKKSTE